MTEILTNFGKCDPCKPSNGGRRRYRERIRDYTKFDKEREKDSDIKDAKTFSKNEQSEKTGTALAEKVLAGEELSLVETNKIAEKFAVKHYFIKALEKAGHGPESYAEQFGILKDISEGNVPDSQVTRNGEIVKIPTRPDTRLRAASGYITHMNSIQGLDSADKGNTNLNIVVVFDRDYKHDRPEPNNSQPVEIISETTGFDECSKDS